MKPQHTRFTDGNFVLHRLTFPGRPGCYSAWYSPAGEVLDAECHIPYSRRTRPVTDKAVKLRALLAAAGRPYVKTDQTH
jgi:hypothetical protein